MNWQMPRIALAVAALIALSTARAGTAFPTHDMPAARDMGALALPAGSDSMSVLLPLKLHATAAAEELLQALADKTSPSYRRYLTPAQFAAQFGPSDDDVAATISQLRADGLTAERTGAATLRVTGSVADMERTFQVSLHRYAVPASATTPAFEYHAPLTEARVPAQLSAVVDGVVGMSTRPMYFPHRMKMLDKLASPTVAHTTSDASALINPFGSLTVADFAKYYGVLPLTEKNVTGAGRTLGIVTFASFTPSDAFAYWKAVGLKVKADRIHVVDVDGGPGAPNDAAGSDETTLDVEQSGGLAPGANVIVYQAPNTNQAYLDAFVKAVDSNIADSISTSWGEWEWYDNRTNGPVTDPYTDRTVSSLRALHQVLLQAALQGQSVFAAAGDAGAYDANDGMLPPDYSLALSVDNPASDSFITAAGGTTLAGTQTYALPKGSLTVSITHERIWSWDYLEPLCADLGQDPVACGIFPVGGGGGVSFEFPLPFYQRNLAGIQKTQPDQAFVGEDSIPPQTLVAIPAEYPGRNVPDVSFNADPDTGYVIYYTSSVSGFTEETFIGGTSFVAPQLNGVVGLIGQYVGGRLGLLNIPLYQLARQASGYQGKGAAFNAIKYGNNDYYRGRDGYSPAAGIGTLNVANFAEMLKRAY